MRLGFLGSGNMATALARGIGDPVLCTDPVAARADALATLTGGEAVADGRTLAERTDVVVLGHKPGQLEAAARDVAPSARAVLSMLAGVSTARLRDAYPGVPVVRIMPNTPAGIGKGVIAVATEPDGPRADEADVRDGILALLRRCATVVELPESQLAAATALFGVLPAYVALVAEATVDAAVRHGIGPDEAGRMAAAGLEGAAALLRDGGHDTLAVRRAVTSPGGSTARGLRELDRHGVREAIQAAFDAAADAS
ncbi:MAG: pyrroline-5-carboxylate reductase [Solirubrobacteraceae bacterium]|nr:pyrroline-5-carboxylate reductase [Solirubrobacteraceae bacterium]